MLMGDVLAAYTHSRTSIVIPMLWGGDGMRITVIIVVIVI